MPYLRIQTNAPLDSAPETSLLADASRLVAAHLGKPESYVMVAVEAGTPMQFAGSDAHTAFLELKSIGLPEDATASLSEALCGLIEQHLGVPAGRVYIEFANAPRHLWGWNAKTF